MTKKTKADVSDKNAALAYKFWRARCFRDGSPEEDLLRAVCANSIKSKPTISKPQSKRRSAKTKSR
jgi:hypothetical protein